ncbi:MAG: ABC transporter ATP-binding protein [Clostridiales bacterium]|jgi:iron complex transport system ATP-binding protein|nr:ABC transporter ATP-binding protein [Clostridiales bacterium]
MYFGFDNISVQYGKKRVLSDINAEFPRGEIITIIGQNGCGKSSLLKTVPRAVKPSKGRVVFEDKSLDTYNRKAIAQKIAYLPQVHSPPSDIDVRTLVSYGRYPHARFGRGMTRADADIIDEALELTGLTALRYRILSTLSGGERQRAWIAMTITQQPQILILDEPTTYLDVSYQLEVLELIRGLNKKLGITIIMVLHDLNMAARYSDKLYVIKNAACVLKGAPRDVLTRLVLRDVFEIDAEIFEDKTNGCPYFIPIKIKERSI